jgi:hypothetical protein
MAATKSAQTIQTGASNTAGSTTTASAVDLTTDYGMLITAKITNGGTGPTVACDFVVEVSNDNSAWKTYARYSAGTTSSAVYEFAVDLPQSTMYARTVFTGNTGQTVTVEAFGHILTGI